MKLPSFLEFDHADHSATKKELSAPQNQPKPLDSGEVIRTIPYFLKIQEGEE